MKNIVWPLLTRKIPRTVFGIIVGAAMVPLAAAASSYFYVATNGSLGIGTDSPLTALDVVGTIYSRLVTDTDSSSLTVDLAAGNVHTITLTTNTSVSFSN